MELTYEGLYKQGAESISLVRTDMFISKTKKLYMDTRTQRNMAKLSEDISEVHSIMTRNIKDVLGQGERLDSELLLFCLLRAEIGCSHD